jgi:hypothetical protein
MLLLLLMGSLKLREISPEVGRQVKFARDFTYVAIFLASHYSLPRISRTNHCLSNRVIVANAYKALIV